LTALGCSSWLVVLLVALLVVLLVVLLVMVLLLVLLLVSLTHHVHEGACAAGQVMQHVHVLLCIATTLCRPEAATSHQTSN
jgi:hypothetical protein